MTEFGHFASGGKGFRIDAWGAGPFVITVAGKSYRFGDSDRFGPGLIKRNGIPLENQPAERSPFWRAHRIWKRQGRRVAEDGVTCIWDEPKATTFYRLTSKTVFIVENGEEDGEHIEIPMPKDFKLPRSTP